eukprot:gb/GEZN01008912.1/.p1 GENE.gb/GEZN01008912.1/~~gb/GEZN01008912.1/.p1  ORF type:complete len:307 (-),score=46.34 gb/GEZN01008912.1/:424-1344(-)
MDRFCDRCGLSFETKGGTVPVLSDCQRGGDHKLIVIVQDPVDRPVRKKVWFLLPPELSGQREVIKRSMTMTASSFDRIVWEQLHLGQFQRPDGSSVSHFDEVKDGDVLLLAAADVPGRMRQQLEDRLVEIEATRGLERALASEAAHSVHTHHNVVLQRQNNEGDWADEDETDGLLHGGPNTELPLVFLSTKYALRDSAAAVQQLLQKAEKWQRAMRAPQEYRVRQGPDLAHLQNTKYILALGAKVFQEEARLKVDAQNILTMRVSGARFEPVLTPPYRPAFCSTLSDANTAAGFRARFGRYIRLFK